MNIVLRKLFHLTHINRPISVKARNNFQSFHNGFLSHEIKVSATQQTCQAKYWSLLLTFGQMILVIF